MTQTKTITINFVTKDGKTKQVKAPVGISLLHAAQTDQQTYLDGSCGGVMACTTCHVIVDDKWYGRIPEISEEENDTLDMAFNVRPTSRLGCQIVLTEDMDGLIVKIPEEDAV